MPWVVPAATAAVRACLQCERRPTTFQGLRQHSGPVGWFELHYGPHDVWTMAQNSVVRARIDEATKAEAAAVLATMGLSLSDAFRLLLKRVAVEKALPFEPLVPNAETIEAMKATRRSELVTAGTSSAALLASLNADC